MPLNELAKWARKRSRDEGGFDRNILVVGDMNIPSRNSVLFQAVRRYGLRLPKALADLEKTAEGTNLSRKATCDRIPHGAGNPHCFTDHAGVVDFNMGDHKPLYRDIESLHEFTFEMSDHLPVWIPLDTWIEDEQLDSMLALFGDDA